MLPVSALWDEECAPSTGARIPLKLADAKTFGTGVLAVRYQRV
jgi:hypothetical protein